MHVTMHPLRQAKHTVEKDQTTHYPRLALNSSPLSPKSGFWHFSASSLQALYLTALSILIQKHTVNISLLLPTDEKVNLNIKITSHQLHFSNLFLVHNYTKCLIVDQERVFIWCFVKDVNLDEGAIAFRDRSARIKSWDSSCWVGAAQIT